VLLFLREEEVDNAEEAEEAGGFERLVKREAVKEEVKDEEEDLKQSLSSLDATTHVMLVFL
jgi:hypothetical protein